MKREEGGRWWKQVLRKENIIPVSDYVCNVFRNDWMADWTSSSENKYFSFFLIMWVCVMYLRKDNSENSNLADLLYATGRHAFC